MGRGGGDVIPPGRAGGGGGGVQAPPVGGGAGGGGQPRRCSRRDRCLCRSTLRCERHRRPPGGVQDRAVETLRGRWNNVGQSPQQSNFWAACSKLAGRAGCAVPSRYLNPFLLRSIYCHTVCLLT